ncbi:uncharacterized protein LOC110265581 [Arachis ipaensis]|uniref:uncharacterized protein LOC110265581 n=1 Tax=Arachis ipaensis TaxID=130454 RepID=UPI000A2B6DC5|nr:uncharacterized protein LOC110265581 [Arachis ipaensis]
MRGVWSRRRAGRHSPLLSRAVVCRHCCLSSHHPLRSVALVRRRHCWRSARSDLKERKRFRPPLLLALCAAAPVAAAGVAAGEGSCASVFLAAGSGSVTFGTTAEASGYFCQCRRILPSPSPESDHRCRLGWLPGLPPSRFEDRRCFGLAILPRSCLMYGLVDLKDYECLFD